MSDSNGTVVAKERKLGEKCIASPYLKIRRCLKVRNSVSQSIDSNDCDMLAGKSTEKVNVTVSEKPLQIRAVSGTLRRVFPLISCFVVCMLIALGATNSKFTFVAVLVSCIIACLTSIIGSKQSNYLLCISVMIFAFYAKSMYRTRCSLFWQYIIKLKLLNANSVFIHCCNLVRFLSLRKLLQKVLYLKLKKFYCSDIMYFYFINFWKR